MRRHGLVVTLVTLVLLAGCSSDGGDTDDTTTTTTGAADSATSDDGGATGGAAASGDVTLVVDGTAYDITEIEKCEPGPTDVIDVVGETADGAVSVRATLSSGRLRAVAFEIDGQEYGAASSNVEVEVTDVHHATGTAGATGQNSDGSQLAFDLTASCG